MELGSSSAGGSPCGALLEQPMFKEMLGFLEKLFYGETAGDWKTQRLVAGTVLGDIFRLGGQWRKLAGVLERLMQLAETDEQRDALLLALAELYESRLSAPFMAFGLAARVLQQRPRDEKIRSFLEGLARRHRMYEELVGLYLDTADGSGEEWAAAELQERAAFILESCLKSTKRATDLRERRTDPGPSPLASARAAVVRADNLPIPVSEAPTVRSPRPAPRADDLVGQRQARQNALFQELYESADELEREGALEEAIIVLRRITDLKPDAGCAWLWLETLLNRAERWPELAVVLEQRLELGSAALGACTTLRLRLAEVLLLKLSSIKGFLHLREVMQDEKLSARGIAILESLRCRGRTWAVHASQWLEPSYRKTSQWEKLCDLLEERLGAEKIPSRRALLFQELIALREQRLGQKMQAFLFACRAFREQPKQLTFRSDLERLALETESLDELATLLDEVAA